MDEQNPRLTAERMTGRSEEQLTGYDRAADARVPEALPSSAAPISRVTTRATTTPGAPGIPEARTREIREEIEQTREEMSETVNAIQDRLRPSNIAANAADTVKHAARQRVREVADSDSVQYVRSNPIPTAMIGIGIAGLAWLAFGGNEPGRRQRHYRDWSRRFDEDRYRAFGAGGYAGSSGAGYAGTPQAAGGYSPGLSYSETETDYTDVRSRGEWRDNDWRDREWQGGGEWRDRGGELADRARQSAYQAQHTAQRAWNENPLLIGAASALLGAVIGMAVPETEREQELMGETRDNLVNSVQETVKEKVGQVQQAATEAMGTVQEAARNATGLPAETDAARPQQPGSIDTGRS